MFDMINNFFLSEYLITSISILGFIIIFNYPMYTKRQKINTYNHTSIPLDIVHEGAALIIQKTYRNHVSNILTSKYKNQLQDIINEDAAITIQRVYRGYACRIRLGKFQN